jgi:hypothetical protein
MIISGNTSQNFINNNTGITKKEVARENKDTVTFGGTNSTPDFMSLKQISSQTAGAGDTAMNILKGTFAAIGGAIGGAIGLAAGAVYSGTVLIPLLVAAGNTSDYAPAGTFGQDFVKQMTSPLRWAIGGAKAGANAVMNSF